MPLTSSSPAPRKLSIIDTDLRADDQGASEGTKRKEEVLRGLTGQKKNPQQINTEKTTFRDLISHSCILSFLTTVTRL